MNRFVPTLMLLLMGGAPPALAQTELPSARDFSLNQEIQQFDLEAKEYETIYRTEYVNETCYRSEVQGTRRECQTQYDRVCHTEYRQQCSYQNFPVCQNIPRNVCFPQQVCRTVMDRVCNANGCVTVPRNICQTINQCQTRVDQVCRNEQRYQCSSYPENVCQNVSRQVCQSVPNVVQVPYSCQKPVQVAAGRNLKLHTVASVTIKFAGFREQGPLQDSITGTLQGDKIVLKTNSTSYFYQVVEQKKTEQVLSPTQKTLQVELTIRAIAFQKFKDFATMSMSGGVLGRDRILFSLDRNPEVPFTGHLLLTRKRPMATDLVIVDRDFDPKLLIEDRGRQVLLYKLLGAEPLNAKRHRAELSLKIYAEALKKGAVNLDLLNQLSAVPVELTLEGMPE